MAEEAQEAAAPEESTEKTVEVQKTALNQEAPAEAQKTALNQEAEEDEGSRDPHETEAEEKKPEAPESYEDFALPEGYEANEADLGEFKTLAKDFNLSQEQAQSLIDFEAKRMQDQTSQLVETWKGQVGGWLDDAKADKEIGGREWNGTLRYANAFVNKFGNEGLREVMEHVGLGNHPEVLRAFSKAGRAISDDEIESGKGPAVAPKSAAELIYNNTK